MSKSTKYKDIKQEIQSDIVAGQYGVNSKLPTENEFCQKYGVSRITIRKALEELATDGYLYKKQGLGTFIKSTKPLAKRDDCNSIALVLPFNLQNDSKIGFDIFSGIDSVIKEENYTLNLYQLDQTEEGLKDFIHRISASDSIGIIITFFHQTNIDLQYHLVKLGLPVVFLDGCPDNLLFDVVAGEDYNSAYRAGKLFISKGYTHIGFFSQEQYNYSTVRARLTGLVDALKDENIEIQDSQFYCYKGASQIADEKLVREMKEYLSHNPDLEAILLFNDFDVMPFFIAAEQMGKKIPDDIKVIGYGNHASIRYYNGGITSFEQHFFQYGAAAAKLLIQRHNGCIPQLQQERLIHYNLIRRASF